MATIPLTETGNTGLSMWAGRPQERYLSNIQGPAGIQIFADMKRKEPACFTATWLVELTARQATWTVTPASSKARDRKAADFVEQCIHDMSHGWDLAVIDALSAQWFGFSLQEIVWKRREGRKPDGTSSAYDDGLVGIKKLPIRRQETIEEWVTDATGGVQAVVQRNEMYQPIRIPIQKLLHFIVVPDRGNPEGLALGEVAYKTYHFLENLEIILGINAERAHVGMPYFLYHQQPTAEIKAAVEMMGEELAVNERAYVALPEPVVSLELLTVSNNNASDLRNQINQLRWELMSIVFGSFIRLGVGDAASRALGETMSEAFTRGIDAVNASIAEVYNRHLIPRLFGYNPSFNVQEYPVLQASRVTHLPYHVLQYLEPIMAWLAGTEEKDNLWLREILGMPAVALTAQTQAMLQSAQTAEAQTPEAPPTEEEDMQDDTQDGDSTEDAKETPMVMPKGQEVALIEKAMSEYAKAANAMKKLAANGKPA